MGTFPARIRALRHGLPQRLDRPGFLFWALSLSIVAYLGIDGGGFDPLVHDQVGIAVWWIVLCGVLVGALPRRRPETLAWVALGLLAAFVAWTALSLGWSESADRTTADLARLVVYAGIFVLALLLRGAKGARRAVAAVGSGIGLIAVVALLSRMQPDWFAQAHQAARYLGGAAERLSFPVDYWNGLAALLAMGLPLLLQVATSARYAISRALAAAALPALMLATFLTLSRAGVAASCLGLAVFLAFASDRLPRLGTLATSAVGGALLIGAASGHRAFRHGLGGAAGQSQGHEMMVLTAVVCCAVGLLQLAATLALRGRRRPRWARIPRRPALAVAALAAVTFLVGAAAFDAPGRASDAWHEFKGSGGPGAGSSRLASAAGESRYAYWSAALDENSTRPLSGTGSGTFELWWSRFGNGSVVRDAHSLYLQTLGELGIVGLLLLGGFLLLVLVGGARRVLEAEPRARGQLAAALGACATFSVTAAVDWTWQLPVLPATLMLLAAVLLTAGPRSRPRAAAVFSPPLRAAVVAVALLAIVAIAIPLSSTSLIRSSEAAARGGNLASALRSARAAQAVQPGAAAPRLQEALVLERRGAFGEAARAAAAAARRAPTDWRSWLVLSRLEAERGRAADAVAAYRRARRLAPHSSLFAGG